jgi:hypothetical protein
MQPTKPLPAPIRAIPPYNTGRVLIGLAHIRTQPWSPDHDACLLQSALLPRSAVRETLRERLSTFFRSFV